MAEAADRSDARTFVVTPRDGRTLPKQHQAHEQLLDGRATDNVVRERTEVRGVIGALTSEDGGRSSTCGAHEPAAA
jgi:hypothetical protein